MQQTGGGYGLIFDVDGTYEFNPSTDRATAGGEAIVTLNAFPLAIGRAVSFPETGRLVWFRWRPYTGVQSGAVVNEGDVPMEDEEDGAYVRWLGRARAQIGLPFLSDNLRLEGDYKLWHLFDVGDSHGYVTGSINYFLTKRVTIGFSYQEGRQPPSFAREQSIGVELGVIFGPGEQEDEN